MLQETMNTVVDAETKADDLVKEARAKADAKIADAKKQAEEIICKAENDAKADLKKNQDNQKRGEEKLVVKALDEATAEIGSLKKHAAEKENEAIDMIIRELI